MAKNSATLLLARQRLPPVGYAHVWTHVCIDVILTIAMFRAGGLTLLQLESRCPKRLSWFAKLTKRFSNQLRLSNDSTSTTYRKRLKNNNSNLFETFRLERRKVLF